MDDVTDAGRASAGSGTSDLVEPEGVNAASSEVLDEHSVAAGDDVTSGGHPERAESQAGERPPETEFVGTPGNQGDAPGQELSVGEG